MDLTYSVQWIPTDVTFARRFDVYLDYPFFEHQVTFCLLSFVVIGSQFHNVFISSKCLFKLCRPSKRFFFLFADPLVLHL